MTIKVGDTLPDGKLSESTEYDPAAGCPINPHDISVAEAAKGKKIVIFAVPGAYTPTCSAKHVPSYVKNYDKLKAKKVDEIWCVATNDAFVMAAWGRDQKADGKVRMLGDGSGEWTRKLGLPLDLIARNMGMRSQRYSMLVENGVVKKLNIEAPGKYEVSGAEVMLTQI
ncbi:MAG TPA: peroxiredoxin [Burkholderiales bacterium]|nr:peroxiredoxin [Burkholderiales bacterium]